jgi:hypothetical protein
MFGVCSSSAKTKVFGAEVACVTRSAAARGEVADLDKMMKGSSAFTALSCSIVIVVVVGNGGVVVGMFNASTKAGGLLGLQP